MRRIITSLLLCFTSCASQGQQAKYEVAPCIVLDNSGSKLITYFVNEGKKLRYKVQIVSPLSGESMYSICFIADNAYLIQHPESLIPTFYDCPKGYKVEKHSIEADNANGSQRLYLRIVYKSLKGKKRLIEEVYLPVEPNKEKPQLLMSGIFYFA
jgi:hypothetical protein